MTDSRMPFLATTALPPNWSEPGPDKRHSLSDIIWAGAAMLFCSALIVFAGLLIDGAVKALAPVALRACVVGVSLVGG